MNKDSTPGRSMSVTRKLGRQRDILSSIKAHVVRTQTELARLLREQGHAVSQPTLSKDIAELGLVKVPLAEGGYRYRAAEDTGAERQGHRLQPAMREFLLEWTRAGQLVVLRTVAGHAAGLAWALDEALWAEVVGTVAGEDTVLVVARTPADAQAVIRRINEVVGR